MVRLQSFLRNPFSDRDITLSEKKKFTEDHLARLSAQNSSGQYTAMLSATNTAYGNYYGELTDKEIQAAIQKSLTQSTDNILEAFSTRNTQLNLYLLSQPGMKDSVAYTAFFPQGVTAFTSGLTKANIEQRMDQIIAAISANIIAAGGSSVLAEYQAFKSNYQSARSAQLSKKAEVAIAIDDREAAEAALDNQLFSNLLTICLNNIGQPERLDNFFDQSIIRSEQRGTTPGETPDPAEASAYGRVTTSGTTPNSSLALEGVAVRIISLGFETYTDEEGNYIIPPQAAGTYDIEYSLEGYQPHVETGINLNPNAARELNVSLQPEEN